MPAVSTETPLPGHAVADDSASREVTRLIDYIVLHHHRYAQRQLTSICREMIRLVAEQGDAQPSLVHLAASFASMAAELMAHMSREERVVFPRIAALASDDGHTDATPSRWRPLVAPLAAVADEHERAAAEMALVRRLAEDYTPPPKARARWRRCYDAIERLETDLHLHLELEDDMLFPLALWLDHAHRAARNPAGTHVN